MLVFLGCARLASDLPSRARGTGSGQRYEGTNVCMCACTQVFMYACMHVCKYVCMHARMHVCSCAGTHVFIMCISAHARPGARDRPHGVGNPPGIRGIGNGQDSELHK